jgi:hypothetical protein
MSDPNDSASTGNGVPLSSTFLEFCAKVRKDDPSVLMYPGEPFRISELSEKEHMEVADALLENNSVIYLQLGTVKTPKRYAEAMAKYVRTSKCLQRICWDSRPLADSTEVLQQREEMLCCLLPAIQESASFK